MENIRLLIVDDHELILKGIKEILKPLKNIIVVGSAMNGKEAIEKAAELRPDVIFMDISMPELNGIEATRSIKKAIPEIKILALTQHEESEYVFQFLNAGGNGYLLKNSTKDDFLEAIDTVLANKRYLSTQVSEQMINNLVSNQSTDEKENVNKVHLTKREREIIQKIADDLSNAQIANELNISLRTVETHRRNIMQKLKVKTVVALLRYASLHDIIKFD